MSQMMPMPWSFMLIGFSCLFFTLVILLYFNIFYVLMSKEAQKGPQGGFVENLLI